VVGAARYAAAAMRPTRSAIALLTVGAAFATASPAQAGSAAPAPDKACEPVRNPYPGTRYEGVDLSHIRALRASCRTARRVARGAHRKALGITVTGPIRRFTWHGWRVTGDLRGTSDRYTARKGTRRVRWRF
jgi:hypothetical protein